MTPLNRRKLLAATLALCGAPAAWGANLDLSAAYRMRALTYTNLNINTDDMHNRSFISNDARLGMAVRKIFLETRRGEDVTMDVGIGLRALGVAGSTTALPSPFSRISDNYPSVNFSPFIEKAYLDVHQLFGYPLEVTFGRQSYRLASGLLLDDNGAGLTGVSFRAGLPWWGMKFEGFAFAAKATQDGPNNLGLFGGAFVLPGEGTWQLSQLIERDQKTQKIYGCSYPTMPAEGCMVSKAMRSFTSLRYQINYGPIVFDGEAAIQRGVATPTGVNPLKTHIIYNGDAQVVRAKWKQGLYRIGEGIARMSLARGSGDSPTNTTSDEAFFPSHGHRFDGLERSGFGGFYGATPYDAFGGNYSSTTVSGLKEGASGIIIVGAGFTPPAYKGIILDIDYFLYQADRVINGSRALGSEWNYALRYVIQDRFTLSASAAIFKAGVASNVTRGTSRKYNLEVSGRF